MPTGDEFLGAARALDELSEEATTLATFLNETRQGIGLRGGRVAEVVEDATAYGAEVAREISAQIAQSAEELRVRALICFEHATELQRWEHRVRLWSVAVERSDVLAAAGSHVDHPGRAPQRPVAPAPWVDPK